jgi:hypothetical protein
MRTFGRIAVSLILLTAWTELAVAQPVSERICNAASLFAARNGIRPTDRMMLWNSTLNGSAWRPAPIPALGVSELRAPKDIDRVYLAYFVVRTGASSGAVSAKISLSGSSNAKPTNQIELYRSAIDGRENRCERRGRRVFENRYVRVNEYMDYHDLTRGGLNSTLEDFHFSYPVDPTLCLQTNAPQARETYQFDDVKRTSGDTFIARNFSITGTAYAVNHPFSKLRSELHYRSRADEPVACVGFDIPLNGSSQASVVTHDHGFGSFGYPVRRAWLIRR